MCVLLWIKLCESMYTPHPVHHANNCAPTLQSKDFWHMHNKTGMFWGLCVKSCGQWHFTPRGRETTKVLYQQNSWTAPANTERRMEDALLFFQSQLVEFCRQLMTVVHWFTKLFSVVYFLLLLVHAGRVGTCICLWRELLYRSSCLSSLRCLIAASGTTITLLRTNSMCFVVISVTGGSFLAEVHAHALLHLFSRFPTPGFSLAVRRFVCSTNLDSSVVMAVRVRLFLCLLSFLLVTQARKLEDGPNLS